METAIKAKRLTKYLPMTMSQRTMRRYASLANPSIVVAKPNATGFPLDMSALHR